MAETDFYDLGRQAYVEGQPRAPLKCQAVVDAVAAYPSWSPYDTEHRHDVMQAFADGWDDAALGHSD